MSSSDRAPAAIAPVRPVRRDGGVTLAGLRALVAVAESGSVSAAARVLGISQPSVSIQLANLEDACGVLLMRRKPQLALTEAGRDLFARARLVLARVDEFETALGDLRGLARGRLSVGLSAPHAAMPLIARFVERFPGVAVSTALGNTAALLDDVARCRLDVGVMTLLGPVEPFACTLVMSQRLALCLRSDDPLAGVSSLTPADLRGRPILLREDGSMTRAVSEAVFAAAAEPLVPRLVLASREAIKEAVAAGLGAGVLFFDELGPDARLAAVPLVPPAGAAGAPETCGVYAVTLPESLEIAPVRAFVDIAAARG